MCLFDGLLARRDQASDHSSKSILDFSLISKTNSYLVLFLIQSTNGHSIEWLLYRMGYSIEWLFYRMVTLSNCYFMEWVLYRMVTLSNGYSIEWLLYWMVILSYCLRQTVDDWEMLSEMCRQTRFVAWFRRNGRFYYQLNHILSWFKLI